MCIYMYKMCVYTTLSLTKSPPAYTPTHTHTHTVITDVEVGKGWGAPRWGSDTEGS